MRYRSSMLITGEGGEYILIDAGPEFRLQGLAAGLHRLDAVLITHAHADHIHGLDDVRPLTRGRILPVYASAYDAEEIRTRFAYAFGHGQEGGGKPRLDLVEIGPEGANVGLHHVTPIPLMHGSRPILGYRIASLAYLTDCSALPEASRSLLAGLDILVLDALRLRPHPTHFSLGEAIDLARTLQPKRLLLTHICHDLSHAQIQAYCDAQGLPFPASPAFDGQELDLPYTL
ncbi:MBL fold metallo-hydrolase [Spirochaetota bacterium]